MSSHSQPTQKDLRWFAGLLIPFSGLMCWLLLRRGVTPWIGWVIVSAGGSIGIVGLVAPQWIRGVYVAWMFVVTPIGVVVTNVLMALVFFGVLWPMALLTKAKQRDVLKLHFDKNATTYWENKSQVTDPRRYFRQF